VAVTRLCSVDSRSCLPFLARHYLLPTAVRARCIRYGTFPDLRARRTFTCRRAWPLPAGFGLVANKRIPTTTVLVLGALAGRLARGAATLVRKAVRTLYAVVGKGRSAYTATAHGTTLLRALTYGKQRHGRGAPATLYTFRGRVLPARYLPLRTHRRTRNSPSFGRRLDSLTYRVHNAQHWRHRRRNAFCGDAARCARIKAISRFLNAPRAPADQDRASDIYSQM